MSQGLHQSNHSKTTQNYSVDAFSVLSEISNPELVSTSSAAPLGTIGGVPIRTRNSSTLSLANCQRALNRWLRVGNACPSTPKALQPTWTGYKGFCESATFGTSNFEAFKHWKYQNLKKYHLTWLIVRRKLANQVEKWTAPKQSEVFATRSSFQKALQSL